MDSRQSKDGREIRRRRECVGCKRRFTTYERIEDALPVVVKADGRREPFDRTKLERGLMHAVAKRPVPVQALRELAEAVEHEISELGVQEVQSRDIGERVLPKLRALDEISYVRFASIYRDFRDIDEFARALDGLKRDGAGASAASSAGAGVPGSAEPGASVPTDVAAGEPASEPQPESVGK